MVAEPHGDRPSPLPTIVAAYAAAWFGGLADVMLRTLAPTTAVMPEGHNAHIITLGLSAAFGAAVLPLLLETLTGFTLSYVGALVALAAANASAHVLEVFLGMAGLNVLLSPATVLWLFVATELTSGHASRPLSTRHF